MNAMVIPQNETWGFDLYLSILSLAFVSIFGTLSLTTLLRARKRSENVVSDVSSAVRSVPPFVFARSVALLAVGAAGAHHTGMWSIRGGVYMVWRPLILLPTLALGGVVCFIAVTVFLLIPVGRSRWICSALLGGGIAMFHFLSTFAMEYHAGPDFGKGPVLSRSSLVLFISLQCGVSFLVTNAYSRTVLEAHKQISGTLQVAAELADLISRMDLAGARKLQAPDQSPLEKQLFVIVSRLEEFRPYLPDVLLQPLMPDSSDDEAPAVDNEEEDDESPRSVRRAGEAFSSAPSSVGRRSSVVPFLHRESKTSLKHKMKAPVLKLGIRTRRAVLLLVNYKNFLAHLSSIGQDEADATIERFSATVLPIVRESKGVIVQASPGRLVVAWLKISAVNACTCALKIQDRVVQEKSLPQLHLSQIIVEDQFLVGNVGTDFVRSFTLVGQSVVALNMLDQLPVLHGVPTRVLCTASVQTIIQYDFHTIPIWVTRVERAEKSRAGQRQILYSVVGCAQQQDWLYSVSVASSSKALWGLPEYSRAFTRYAHGDYQAAIEMAHELNPASIAGKHSAHLLRLCEEAMHCRIISPVHAIFLPRPQIVENNPNLHAPTMPDAKESDPIAPCFVELQD
eukprot:TRINITY_DN93335_c0_g1_i1.p1 TRINITY_DN93335_c0_g1~~TRINITY_DN93335_c0_g1_i1.p1  ORF type:complete len:693 (-),score=104.76 TRINITY_DN93335_c0_g1_i1:58-1929(-)